VDASKLTVHARSYPKDAEKDAEGRPVLTNFYWTAYVVKVGGALTISGTSQLIPDCDNDSGNPIRFDVQGDITIGRDAMVDARMAGFGWVQGSTKSTTAGVWYLTGGTYAGEKYAPYAPGAPSGVTQAPTRGGGVIWFKTPRRMFLDGTLDASGACRLEFNPGGTEGGSSGGGIWLACQKLVAGESAIVKSYGGYNSNPSYAGGGGGAICVSLKVSAEKLAQQAGGMAPKGCTYADEINVFPTDVTGHVSGSNNNPGPSGTTVTVTGSPGFLLHLR